MEEIPTRFLYLGLAALAVLIALYLLKRAQSKKGDSDDFLERVRRHVAAGEFDKAALLQLKRGNKREAFNLLERGEVHDKASGLAEQLGMLEKAAFHAEKAGDFSRAATFYEQSQDFSAAGRLYKRSGLFHEAAQAMERDPGAEPLEIARMWEHACLAATPAEDLEQEDDQKLGKVRELAEKTAMAYKKAGNNQRAATFFEMCQRRDEAKRARGVSVEQLHQKMTQGLAGEPTARIAHTEAPLELTEQTMSPAQVIGTPALGTAAQVQGSGSAPVVQREVIYVRDALTDQTTAVSRETDRYTIDEKLGEGGMAVVYKATDTVLERQVALKFLPEGFTQNAMALRYFEREARAAARLTHPNIVTIYDCGLIDGRPFISMELIDGTSLDHLLEDNPEGLPLRDVLQVAEGLLAALEVAHRNKVLHRDIKPANLMWTGDGLIKLMDFGIAGSVNPNHKTIVAGTPYYMAPEQFEGTDLDERTDLFAVGVTLYELMTGELPYAAQKQRSTPRRASELRPAVPEAFDDLLLACIQSHKEARPPSAVYALEVVRQIQRDLEATLREEDSVMRLAMATPLHSLGEAPELAPPGHEPPTVLNQLTPAQIERLSHLSADLNDGVPLDDESRDMLRGFGIEPEENKDGAPSTDISKALQAYLNSDHEFLARIEPRREPTPHGAQPPARPNTAQRAAPVGRLITREVQRLRDANQAQEEANEDSN